MSSLPSPAAQLARLDALPLARGDFAAEIAASGWSAGLTRSNLDIFQINIGKLCNMTCAHCHVDAGPTKVAENMDRATMELCLAALDRTNAHTVDITGGAPELNANFRWLVEECVSRGKHVIDRCNLTVLLLAKNEDLPEFFAERAVEVVCSLPHYRKLNTDKQRGDGTFDRSIQALQRLNSVGYGKGDPRLVLTLMHNPAGAYLPSAQRSMEREWKAGLLKNHGVFFDRLIALNNMPISRFLSWLESSGNTASYMETLTNAYNPGAVAGLMCRNTISIGWDGQLYDCDFNQMLALPVTSKMHVREFHPDQLGAVVVGRGKHQELRARLVEVRAET